MWRVPVGTQIPVEVVQHVPTQINDTLLRYNWAIPFAGANPTTIGPDTNTTWDIEAVHLDFTSDANAGNRNLYYYAVDRNDRSMRYMIYSQSASERLYAVMTPSASIYLLSNGNVKTFSGPAMVSRLDAPCKVGFYWDNFQGAGDVATAQMMVRERTQL